MASPEIAAVGLQAGFNQDIAARVLSALSSDDGFIVLSGEDKVAAEQLPFVVSQLRSTSFSTISIAAPISRLAMLDDAIRSAMTPDVIAAPDPLIVIIEHSEKLTVQILQRLIALSELRQSGRPVLRFLLCGTPAQWSVLRAAGLGVLEDDATAHIRLLPDLTPGASSPGRPNVSPRRALGAGFHASPAGQRDPVRPDRAKHEALPVAAGMLLAGIGVAAWLLLPSRPPGNAVHPQLPPTTRSSDDRRFIAAELADEAHNAPQARKQSADDRLTALIARENKEIAANHLWSPPNDNLMETLQLINALVSQVSPGALPRLTEAAARADAVTRRHVDAAIGSASPAETAPQAKQTVTPALDEPQWIDGTIHVTVRYSRDDPMAEARAVRILVLLHGRGVSADGPVPTDRPIGQSSLLYGFPQDGKMAQKLAQLLHRMVPGPIKPTLGSFDAGAAPRPGEITLSIGPLGTAARPPSPPG